MVESNIAWIASYFPAIHRSNTSRVFCWGVALCANAKRIGIRRMVPHYRQFKITLPVSPESIN